MNSKSIQWLYQELPELIKKDVLTQEAADKLRQHYGEVKSADKKRLAVIICGVLGSLLIGLGIILLLAHNWEQLPRFTRVILSFLPLVIGQALAFWVLLKKSESVAFMEGAATFLSLMVGASIALVNQTYHISDNTSDFILSWMLLIVPLVYLMKATIPAVIYIVGITAWSGHFWDSPIQAVLFWPLIAVVIPHFIWSLYREIYTIRATIFALVMAISVCFGAGFSLGRTWLFYSWVVIYSSILSLFYLIGSWKFANTSVSTYWQRPLRVIGEIAILVFAFLLTFRFPWESIRTRYYDIGYGVFSLQTLPNHAISIFIIFAAILLCYNYAKRGYWLQISLGVLPLVAAAGYSMSRTSIDLSVILFNVYLFIVSIIRIVIGVRNNSLSIINTGMLILSALILARFFDSEISFVFKGLVFIFVGIGFLITNAVIVRQRGGK